MNLIKHLLFILKQRRAGNRVSFAACIKGHERIELGRGCKIHAAASVDASRSPGVRFGDTVTLNRYACVQGGDGAVAGAVVREDVPAYAVVAGVPATVKKMRD